MAFDASNAKDFLPLLQALADGKTIQHRACSSDRWTDGSNLSFADDLDCYRIKPETKVPRVLYVNIFDDGTNEHIAYEDGSVACVDDSYGAFKIVERAVKFIEVLEDENSTNS
jgi:hypothetical protein